MDQVQDLYADDELDSEWAQYVASLNTESNSNSRRNREKRKIVRSERESMTNLQKHVRGLSQVSFRLTADAAIQLFDGESSSDSDTETGTVNILSTPISRRDKLIDFDVIDTDTDTDTESHSDSDSDSIDLASSDSDSDAVPPTPTETPQSRPKSHHKAMRAMRPIDIANDNHKKETDADPYNIGLSDADLNESRDSETELDLDINDNHSLFSTNDNDNDNDSRDHHCDPSDSDDDSKSFKLSTSRSSSMTKSPRPHQTLDPLERARLEMESEMEMEMDIDVEYDAELEALKKELSHFQRRNRQTSRMRRTKSREEVLLSVLKIDCDAVDGADLSKCTHSALSKYNAAEWRSPSPATMTPIPELHPERYLLESGQLSPVPVSVQSMESKEKERGTRKEVRRLADPYSEEWNGLDPADYLWCDAVPEGECFDDDELSLYDRRVQYLVVTAIDEGYCDISDLSYSQNELLLMHQDSLVW